jgi:sterol desaturase/sphingolipid hydroxylase (fatty acid hydroxylase superfamily)
MSIYLRANFGEQNLDSFYSSVLQALYFLYPALFIMHEKLMCTAQSIYESFWFIELHVNLQQGVYKKCKPQFIYKS